VTGLSSRVKVAGSRAALTVDLTTMLADVLFSSPVLVASGCGGNGRELSRFTDLREVGALVTPSVTRDGGPGAPLPRTVETPSGVLHAVGLPGTGIDAFLAADLPWLLRHDIRPIVSVAGTTLGEYAELARRVGNTPGIAGIEVNLALAYPGDPVGAGRAVSVMRRDTAAGVPVFAKLWPGAAPLADLAASVLQAGADAVVLPGSVPGLALHPVTLRPRLGAVVGELSGPAVRSAGLFAVWEVRRALPDACLIAAGGVRTGTDVLDYLAVGADAVQVGSSVLSDPSTPGRVVGELRQALADHGFENPRRARDVAHQRPTRGE
jgi:dihydroorotate dehydrogenase (NAD+) catalytic subunit